MARTPPASASKPRDYVVVRPIWWHGQALAVGENLAIDDQGLATELCLAGRVAPAPAKAPGPASPNAEPAAPVPAREAVPRRPRGGAAA